MNPAACTDLICGRPSAPDPFPPIPKNAVQWTGFPKSKKPKAK